MAAPSEALTSRQKGIMYGSLAVGAGILGVGLYLHLTKRKKKRKKKIRKKKKDKKQAKGNTGDVFFYKINYNFILIPLLP